MATMDELTTGWTGRRSYTLGEIVNNVFVPLALDPSWTVELLLRGQGETDYVATAGDVTKDADQSANPGKVHVDLDADDLPHAQNPFDARFKVTDSDGKVVFFPNGKADQVFVYRP